jgi:hypothetical protein
VPGDTYQLKCLDCSPLGQTGSPVLKNTCKQYATAMVVQNVPTMYETRAYIWQYKRYHRHHKSSRERKTCKYYTEVSHLSISKSRLHMNDTYMDGHNLRVLVLETLHNLTDTRWQHTHPYVVHRNINCSRPLTILIHSSYSQHQEESNVLWHESSKPEFWSGKKHSLLGYSRVNTRWRY